MTKDTAKTDTVKHVYEAGEGRKTILAFVFIVLLPFLASLPVMIFMRGFNGLWRDAASAIVLAILFGVWMLFLLVNVMSSFRTRVVIDDEKVKFSVPRWRGPSPDVRYIKDTVELKDIEAVETRGEIYQAVNVPVMMRATVLKLKDGRQHLLGYVNENSPDPALPYPEIGRVIADRAGVPFVDKGRVDAGHHARAMLKGPPDWDARPLSEGAYHDYQRDNQWAMLGLAFLLFGLAGVGLFADLYRSGWFSSVVPG